jgi:hypothetical protein
LATESEPWSGNQQILGIEELFVCRGVELDGPESASNGIDVEAVLSIRRREFNPGGCYV